MNDQGRTMPTPAPWWKFGHVWLILAGPALVVVAGFVTLYIAVRMPDPVVSEDHDRKGIEINKTLEADAASLAPAVQARNHAATGAPPPATDKR
ncbi:MAG: FixH family protein [Burkholderiales bacterium]|nr:FixH family protein [Burkholderiales bacterium]